MALAAPAALIESIFREPDWSSLGLVASIVGCFLIANGILFEHPRRLVERHFGRRNQRGVHSIRESIYSRVETTLGVLFLMGGFVLQLVARYRPLPEPPALGGPPLSMAWIGVIVVVAVGLLLSGWWWSLHSFRRIVRKQFRANPSDLEGDPAMARELGELFGIESFEDDTVEAYVTRLREKAGLPIASREGERTRALPHGPDDEAGELEEAF